MHYSRWTKYSNLQHTMLNSCSPESQCFSAGASKSDVGGLISDVHWGEFVADSLQVFMKYDQVS